MAKLSMSGGFTNGGGVSVDVLYLKINDVLEYNLPYVQSNFMCIPGPMWKKIWTRKLFKADDDVDEEQN